MDNLWYKYKNILHINRHTLHSIGVGFVSFFILYLITKFWGISVCPIKNIFGISCFGCGLTRGFISILHLDIKSAFSYNVMSLPLFVCISIYCILCVVDIVFEKKYINKIEKQLSKKYMYIVYVFILLVSAILNNIF